MRMFAMGKELKDDLYLYSYDIMNEMTVQVMIRQAAATTASWSHYSSHFSKDKSLVINKKWAQGIEADIKFDMPTITNELASITLFRFSLGLAYYWIK